MIEIGKLREEIKGLEKNVITDGYLMSLGEIVNLYKSDPKELIINPKFQRVFRWSKEQKSKLIESLILGLPLPGIFVAENEKGIWEVVDGLQRLSTILEFMGELDGENYIPTKNKIKDGLESTILLPNLEGIKWIGNDENMLPDEYKLRIKRTRIYVSILKNTGDLKAKYEVFQRLNTGGSKLSDQEVRNCIIIDKREDIYDIISALSTNKDFINTISIIGNQAFIEKEDMELVLRYMALKNVRLSKEIPIKDLIDSFVYKVVGLNDESNPFNNMVLNIKRECVIFEKVFSFLNDLFGEESFYSRANDGKIRLKRLKNPVFDTIVQGIGFNIEEGNIDLDNEAQKNILRQKILCLQKDDSYLSQEIYKNGNGSARRLKLCSEYGKNYFKLD